jgi:hypothetical protein
MRAPFVHLDAKNDCEIPKSAIHHSKKRAHLPEEEFPSKAYGYGVQSRLGQTKYPWGYAKPETFGPSKPPPHAS